MQSLWIQDPVLLVILVVATEAVVHLIKEAGPIQPLRSWLIQHTPWLESKAKKQHLLNCGYCMSVWVALLLIISVEWWQEKAVFCLCILCVHRLSNLVHLVWSLLTDVQRDIRVARYVHLMNKGERHEN